MKYAGIGSRKTPIETQKMMFEIGAYLSKRGLTLRSGGADGADLMFERGCDSTNGKKEIYLPWKGFNRSNSNLYSISQIALDSVDRYHPNPFSLSFGARKLMARNYYQMMGMDTTSSSFIVCWTSGGTVNGGTGQAMRIANDYNIPIVNLFGISLDEAVEKINKIIEGVK